jgi:hypothetical protein
MVSTISGHEKLIPVVQHHEPFLVLGRCSLQSHSPVPNQILQSPSTLQRCWTVSQTVYFGPCASRITQFLLSRQYGANREVHNQLTFDSNIYPDPSYVPSCSGVKGTPLRIARSSLGTDMMDLSGGWEGCLDSISHSSDTRWVGHTLVHKIN